MKCVLAVSILMFAAALGSAQTAAATAPSRAPEGSSPSPSAPSMPPDLDIILTQIHQATQSANDDINRLRIDRWKASGADRAQLQQVADSLHKNITYAVPDLISDVRIKHGSVSSAFKLYHNINVVFEYLNSLTDAAGSLGKSEEYDPLNSDTAALDKARQQLSSYIEQAAASMENQLQAALARPAPTPVPQATPKKVVVDDESPAKKRVTQKKKKASTPPPHPSPTPN